MSTRGGVRKALLVVGVSMLGLAAILLIGVVSNLLPADVAAVAGHSGLRGIGGIAVMGCLLAAVGSDDS